MHGCLDLFETVGFDVDGASGCLLYTSDAADE